MTVGLMPVGTWIAPRISATPTTFMPHSLEDGARADRHAERCRAGVTEGAPDGERFTRHGAGDVMSGQHGHGVHDPTHDLGVRVDIGCRDVAVRSDHRGDGEGVAPGQSLEFGATERRRIDANTTFGSAVGDIDDGALNGHVGTECRDLVDVDTGVEANAALAWSARGAVLDTPTVKHLDLTGVHANRDRYFENPLRGHDSLYQTLVQTEQAPGGLDERRDMQPRIEFVRDRLRRTRDHVVTSL